MLHIIINIYNYLCHIYYITLKLKKIPVLGISIVLAFQSEVGTRRGLKVIIISWKALVKPGESLSY